MNVNVWMLWNQVNNICDSVRKYQYTFLCCKIEQSTHILFSQAKCEGIYDNAHINSGNNTNKASALAFNQLPRLLLMWTSITATITTRGTRAPLIVFNEEEEEEEDRAKKNGNNFNISLPVCVKLWEKKLYTFFYEVWNINEQSTKKESTVI